MEAERSRTTNADAGTFTCTRPGCRRLPVVLYSAPSAQAGWQGPLCWRHHQQLLDRLDREADRRYRPWRWAVAFFHRWSRLDLVAQPDGRAR